jgi:hypothetical protein
MFMDCKTVIPISSFPSDKLRENCLGCKDCKGACLELLNIQFLPEILTNRREERS